ncbi:MAG: tyrosine-type recombinase/integrase [Synergistaceae bacterium]|jgi:integrase|nr:tyrosine-type recombinase/integrase [Synergistaceae bacterium]
MKTRVNKTTQPIRSQSDRDAISGYFWRNNYRDYALFIFGIYTGRRIVDLVKLDVRDVAYINKRLRFTISERLKILEKKTGKFIDLLLHPSARRALSKYLRPRLKASPSMGALLNEPLFRSRSPRRTDGQYRITQQHAWRILNSAARACGLNYKIGTHSLRKTFGYMLYQNNTNIELIQQLLNHSSPAITLAYIGITQDDMDEAILGLG